MASQSDPIAPPMPKPDDYIPVIRHHLALSFTALEAAYNISYALDIAEALRAGGSTSVISRHTRTLESTMEILDAYLRVDEEKVDEPGIPAVSNEE